MAESKADLNPRQLQFVRHFCSTSNAGLSARKAGYSEKNSRQTGAQLLQSEKVQAAIQRARDEITKQTNFDLKHAVDLCEEGIVFAKEKNNSMAYFKFSELKMRLHGLLIDRAVVDINQTPNLALVLERMKARIAMEYPPTTLPVIEIAQSTVQSGGLITTPTVGDDSDQGLTISRVLKIPILEQISRSDFFSELNFLKFFVFSVPNSRRTSAT